MNDKSNLFVSHRVRGQFYLDSVALMRMSRDMATQPGVRDAAMMMATPVNLEIMQNAGLLPGALPDVASADLLMAVAADTKEAVEQALEFAEALLDAPAAVRNKAGASNQQIRSLRQATTVNENLNLALISVTGEFAAAEAAKAIGLGMNVMIFSDNVALDDEVSLKQQALAAGCLVMGPDCGTANINTVPLAFANRVPAGRVGIVGASGTGIQEVTCLLAQANQGISHAIGVGGRDLSDAVGGISTLQALDLLETDPATEVVVLISKPPAKQVRELVMTRVTALVDAGKPVVVCFVGDDSSQVESAATDTTASIHLSSTLEEAALLAIKLCEPTFSQNLDTSKNVCAGATHSALNSADSGSQRRSIRGLFCGGTLCAEAQVILLGLGEQVASNAAVPGAGKEPQQALHSILDLGADEFTLGKPHPMIEPSIRDASIEEAMNDPETAVVLLDCVLGFGSHADPAGCIADVLRQFPQVDGNAAPYVVASVTGTDEDPQHRSAQVEALVAVGVVVCHSNAAAVREAARLAAVDASNS